MHIPVLRKQVLQYLDPKPNENIIDCTANGGGHAIAIFNRIESGGRLLAIEWDKKIAKDLKARITELSTSDFQISVVNDSYVNLKTIVEENNFKPVDGILFDLGMSSKHLEESGRGFTFQKNEPLDMRYNTDNRLTAGEIVNSWSEKEITEILRKYGEEKFAVRIARNIVKSRPLKTTFDLVGAIGGLRKKIHPATKTFQALRIVVNKELESLEKTLPQAEEILAPGGRLVVISFHSLEDRIVKNFFRDSKLKVLTKKPITGLPEEISGNPRARSAKLRAGTKQ